MTKRTGRHSHRCTRMICAALCAATCVCACQGPEETTRKNNYAATDGDEYILDVFMLAEWAGRIIPQKEAIRFNLKFEDSDASQTIIRDANTNETLNNILSLDNNSVLSLHPYGTKATDSSDELISIEYACSKIGDDTTTLDGQYICPTYRTGVNEIARIWDYMARNNNEKSVFSRITIGSGDNFGVSQPISSIYKDFPAIQMLNLLGLSAETFGNHTFDYNLPEIQSLMEAAEFPFIISNFYNLPNNLEGTTPFTIFTVPPQNKSGSDLNVAVVAAFDDQGMEIISRGRFGTIGITDYCPLIQTLEEAYNKNARAFIILSHVFTDRKSVQKFFNGIFSLDESFLAKIKDKNTESTADYPCRSHLLITEEMLDSSSSKSKEEQAAELRLKLHQEIYDNILLVFGEATYSPFLVNMYPGTGEAKSCASFNQSADKMHFEYHPDGCIPNEASLTTDIYSMFSSHNRIPTPDLSVPAIYKDFEKELTHAGIPSFEFNEEMLKPSADKHPIWFVELPPRGNSTARALFKISKQKNINTNYHAQENTAAAYRSEMINFKLMPVFAKTYEKNDYDSKKCDDIIQKPKACQEYYSNYKDYLYKEYLKKQGEKVNGNKKPDYNACIDEMLSAEGSLKDFQEKWTCLYNVTQWGYNANNKTYSAAPICTLGKYTAAAENKDNEVRKYSTFLSNLVTDTLLRAAKDYVAQKDKRGESCPTGSCKVDAVYINAGNTRETIDFSNIDNEFLNTAMPYENKMTAMTFSVIDLVPLLEFGLNSEVTGAFPAIAGIKFSYGIDKDNKKYIRELWKYDLESGKHELLYVHKNVKSKDCILGAQIPDKTCIYGQYTNIGSEGITISHSDDFTDTSTPKPNEKAQLVVILSGYMVTGGDGFPRQDTRTDLFELTKPKDSSALAETDKDAFKKAFDNEAATTNETMPCQIRYPGLELDLENLLMHNLIKRIYYVPNAGESGDIGVFGFSYDHIYNICVATQDTLATSLGAEQCHYELPK
ncbi:MAG: 5'-nucleotidase C-terminal domain-containing protein [Proteobacteria bacterium]|nr:5'-nucleotidase C-terminal domain-containing protein [Pseudomonadota bacterium]